MAFRTGLSAVLLSIYALSAQTSPLVGDWSGDLKTPGGVLKIVLHVKPAGAGLEARLDSVTQGAYGLAVDEISLTDGKVLFTMKTLNARFEGTLAASPKSITGQFTQGATAMPLTLTPGLPPPPNRPQEPKPPFPYTSLEVSIPNAPAGVTLAGVLTIPPGKGPFPAAILLSGSGPQDRDEAIMGHKPFAVLADHLARQGVAVLRYDDRGFGKSTGAYALATIADFATDAAAAFDFLAARPEIDRGRIGYIGHSEGGTVAPIVAAARTEVAFVVMMAGTGVTGEQVLLTQAPAVMRANGLPQAAIEQNSELQKKIFAVLREEKDPAALPAKLSPLFPPGAQADAQVRQFASPWMRYFIQHDPAPVLAKTKCPFLVMNGELDMQILPDVNLPPIEKALAGRESKAPFVIERLPGLNHLFQTAQTGAPAEYAQIEETIAPAALNLISAWIRKTTGVASR